MRSFGIATTAILLLFSSQIAFAVPSWVQISFQTTPTSAPKIAAAADALMASKAGKTFPGKLLLQAITADGNNPATHSFVPIYRSTAEREDFLPKLQADPAWAEFTAVMSQETQPVSTVLFRNVKSWGDINDTDHVWAAHAFSVSDAPGFLAAIEQFLASKTGKKSPGQVYLSGVVAGGLSPVTHMISIGYASETEMEAWVEVRNASQDWADYQAAARDKAEYLGTTLARDVKSWGSATLEQITKP